MGLQLYIEGRKNNIELSLLRELLEFKPVSMVIQIIGVD